MTLSFLPAFHLPYKTVALSSVSKASIAKGAIECHKFRQPQAMPLALHPIRQGAFVVPTGCDLCPSSQGLS